MVALPAWLAARGHSSAEVGGFLAAVSFPWTLKLFTGPVMDRFAFLPMGRRRPWVLAAQSGILVGSLLLAGAPQSFGWILALGFAVNFFAAWQDVAVDGMAIDVLAEDERARANAFMFGGQSIGIAASSAGGAYLLSAFGLMAAALVMAACVGIIFVIPLLLRERPGERLLPWTPGHASARSAALQEKRWGTIFRDLLVTLALPMSVLLVLVKFGDRVAAGLLGAAMPVMTTQELGYAQTFYPQWNAASGIVAALFGVLVAPLVDRFGARRALVWGLVFKILLVLGAAMLAAYWARPTVMIGIIIATGLGGQLLTIATIALFMHLCTPRVAATQFAVYMALSNLALSAGSALLGPFDAWLDFRQLFFAVAAIDVVALSLLRWFDLERHQQRLRALMPQIS